MTKWDYFLSYKYVTASQSHTAHMHYIYIYIYIYTAMVSNIHFVSCHNNIYVLLSWTCYLWYFSPLTLKMSENVLKHSEFV